MKSLVFLLEEPSARDLLEGLLPRLLPEGYDSVFLTFEGKQDLERNVTRKLQGWLRPDSLFIILRDQDAGDCHEVKRSLLEQVAKSGRSGVLVRVACREIESWFLGDWVAVAKAYERPKLAANGNKGLYRSPDRLSNPAAELRKHLPYYQKRDGARRMGALLDPARNTSTSFRAFCQGIQRLVGAGA